MNGRNEFTSIEVGTIIQLLKEKMIAAPKDQKRIRDKLRKIGFYITDYDNSHRGFSDIDFNNLIENNLIAVLIV